MAEEQGGLIAQIKKEGWAEAIVFLLKTHSIGEVANLFDMDERAIAEIIAD